jgi:hypothetical protein
LAWAGSSGRHDREFTTVTIKTSIFAAVAAVLVSSITVGAAIAPASAQAQVVNFPVRTMVNA